MEGLFEKATAEGGFGRSARLLNDWNNLGLETKSLLFKDPQLINKLDNFFLLAKRMAENPNPSGTASVLQLHTLGGTVAGALVNLPAHPAQIGLTVHRVTPGQAATVELAVIDGCGSWPTFVGGGPSAF